eukprot:s6671_g2.t1
MCNCLTHPLSGREDRTTPEHIRRNGCVHVFRDPEQCDQVDVDLGTHRGVHENENGWRLQRLVTRTSRSGLRPRPDAGPPKQGCRECQRMCDAVYCQVAEKFLEKPHRPELCPKCLRIGKWCHGSIHKADIVMRYSLVASLLDSSILFRPSEAGLEADLQYEGRRVLLLLRPWLYIVPEHRGTFTTTGQEEAVLRPDRQPAGADERVMFRRALRMVMSERAEIMQWPAQLSLADTVAALGAFAAQTATISPPSDDAARAVQAAVEGRDVAELQRTLELLQVPQSTNDNESMPCLADRFRGFLRLQHIGPRAAPASAGSSSSDQAPAASSTGPALNGATTDQSSAVQAFTLASNCMGGKLVGPWRCFRVDDRQDYGQRHGYTYWKPHGWVKRRLQVDNYDMCRTWPIAYHGTSLENAPKILLTNLRRPGQGGATKAHGAAGARKEGTVYVTPSIYYAAHPVYAPLNQIENSSSRWFQVVLQCKVEPEAFRVQCGTLSNKHWPRDLRMDPNFNDHSQMEWLVDDEGSLATQLTQDDAFTHKGAEYMWTELLAEEHRRRGFLIG